MENGKYVDGSIWFYAPNKVAPIIWAILFLVSGLWHAYQCIRYKCWKVTGIFPWSALIFVVGYIFREIGAFHFSSINVYIVSQVFIACAPPLYELQNYFILSRILYYVPYHSPIHPGRVLTTFAGLSAIVEALNGNGVAYAVNSSLSESKRETGKSLLKTALILQLVILCSFVFLAGFFHRRCQRASLLPKNLNAILVTLYVSSALICVRTIYRTYEYFSSATLHFEKGFDVSSMSVVLRYEWFFWVFEAVLMALNSFLLNWRHPMRFLPRDNKVYLAEDGKTEIQGPGYGDERNFFVTLFDPFDIAGMLKGRNMQKRFWDTHDEGRLVTDAGQAEKGSVAQGGVNVAAK